MKVKYILFLFGVLTITAYLAFYTYNHQSKSVGTILCIFCLLSVCGLNYGIEEHTFNKKRIKKSINA